MIQIRSTPERTWWDGAILPDRGGYESCGADARGIRWDSKGFGKWTCLTLLMGLLLVKKPGGGIGLMQSFDDVSSS